MATSDQVFGTGPSPAHFAITPGNAFPRSIRAVYVGAGGNMTVTDSEGTPILYKNLPSGSVLSIMVPKGATAVANGTMAADLGGWV